MDFSEAEREFRRLEEMRSTGRISEDEYRGRLSALRVTDQDGQVWMLQERTGQWYVYYGNQWMPATPAGRQSAAVPPGTAVGPAGYAAAPEERGGGCGRMAVRIGVWPPSESPSPCWSWPRMSPRRSLGWPLPPC